MDERVLITFTSQAASLVPLLLDSHPWAVRRPSYILCTLELTSFAADTGANFSLSQIEASPASFFSTSLALYLAGPS